jgi:hypothetical protein
MSFTLTSQFGTGMTLGADNAGLPFASGLGMHKGNWAA